MLKLVDFRSKGGSIIIIKGPGLPRSQGDRVRTGGTLIRQIVCCLAGLKRVPVTPQNARIHRAQ
jgi:hypothetical protein